MSLSLRATQVALVLCSVIGIYGTYYLAEHNGTFDYMRALQRRSSDKHTLPLTEEPIRKFYTGIDTIDKQLQVLAVFFWTMVTGDNPAASTQIVHFAGQFAAAYVLVVLEAMRYGNKGRIISYIMLWGILYQNVAYAVTIPLTLATHLGTSPGVKAPPSPSALLAHSPEIASITGSVFVGYIVPAILMALPFPSVVTSDQKQIYMAVWQVFPISVAVLQQVFKRVLSGSSSILAKSSPTTTIWCLRLTYAFALMCAGTTHLQAVSLAGAYDLFPPLFDKNHKGSLGLRRAFVPGGYLPSHKVANVNEGALRFLQYDEYIGSTAVLIWASFMAARAWPKDASSLGAIAAVFIGAFTCITRGPIAAATILLWMRDEIVLESALVSSGKKTK